MNHSRTVRKGDMTEGRIWRQILLFSLPLIAGNLFQQLYSTIDSVVVGNFVGADALGAVTSNMPAINTLIGLFTGFSTGAGVVISQYFGAKNREELREAVHTSVVASVLFGILLTVLGVAAAPGLVRLMRTPASVAPLAITYLRIYFGGVLGLTLYNMGSGILRAVGDSRRPLYFLIFCSAVNTVLDLFFVILLRMGVAGVAYATILSQFLSTILVFAVLFRSREDYGLRWQEMRIHKEKLQKIILIGLPAGLQLAITSFSNLFVQGYINFFGAGSTAGWGAYQRIDSFTVLPVFSFGLAETTFVGQNAGAGKTDRIRHSIRSTLLLGACITIPISLITIIFAPQAIGFFGHDEGVLHYGVLYLRLLAPFDFLMCVIQVYSGMLRGVGDSTPPMAAMLGSFVVFRQIYLFVISRLHNTPVWIAFSYVAGWMLCATVLFIYYRHCHWENRVQDMNKQST